MRALVKIVLVLLSVLSICSSSTGWVIDDDVKVDFDETNDRTKDVMQSTTNSVLGQHKVSRVVKLWFEEPNYDSCPRMFRALGCQEHLLSGYEKSGYLLPVDLVLYIRNDTGYHMRIGEEQFTCGYYCLEIDIRLTNGNTFAAQRKEGVWYRNFIREEDVYGEKIHRRLVSLNPRLWTGLPSEVCGDKVYLRPRLAFFSFVNEHRRYRSISDLEAGRESKSWNSSREGELVGDWLMVSADRFRSWMHNGLKNYYGGQIPWCPAELNDSHMRGTENKEVRDGTPGS